MSTSELIIRLGAGLVFILVNAFFVLTEFALTRLRQLDESEFQDHSSLRLAWKMTERLEIYLTSCQLGITSSSILMGVVVEPGVTALIMPVVSLFGFPAESLPLISIVTAIIFINLIHKIWGEQAPTYLGVERPKQVVRWTAHVHYWWTMIMYPIVIAGDGLAKATLRVFGVKIERSWMKRTGDEKAHSQKDGYPELRREMGEILIRGRLPKERRHEVLRALDIDTIPVRKIMVPRDDIVAARLENSVEENFRLMADQRRFTRFPLIADSLEDFRGVLYIADVFHHLDGIRAGEIELVELATPPMTVSAKLPVSKLIDQFQKNKQELALVKECERVVGLVTITEALEAIAGEVEDPFDSAVAANQ